MTKHMQATCGLLLCWLDVVAIGIESLISSGRRATFINSVQYNFKFNLLTWFSGWARRFSNASPAASRGRCVQAYWTENSRSSFKIFNMPIRRCSEQKRKTLEQFYSEFIPEKNQFWADVGTAMLKVVKLINDTFKETKIYGLTSHASLNFLIHDNSETDTFVTISSSGDEFHIEFLMTENNRPWPGATVKGATKSIDNLKNLIIIAMTESQGWPDSLELKNLYNSME